MALTTRMQDQAVVDLSAGRWRRAWRETGPDDTILEQFLNSQSELNARLALAGGGRAVAVEGANLADSRSAVPYLNQAVLARPAPRSDDPVYDEIEDFFGSSRDGTTLLSLWPTADLWHRGWVLYGHPVLVAKSPVLSVPSRPEGLEIEVVNDRDGVARAEDVVIDGYPVGEPGDPSSRPEPGSVLPAGVIDTGCTLRIAWLDGTPVAAGLSYVSHGVVNLAMAATLPAARRRGVWQALVQARLADGPGLPAVAYTNDLTRPGFLRLGFLPVARLTLWGRG
jgi:hypothetical protein